MERSASTVCAVDQHLFGRPVLPRNVSLPCDPLRPVLTRSLAMIISWYALLSLECMLDGLHTLLSPSSLPPIACQCRLLEKESLTCSRFWHSLVLQWLSGYEMHHGHSTFMLPSCAISGECSTCEGYLPCSEPYLNPLSPYTNFALMDCLSLSHFRAWLYVHFFSLKLWFTDHLSRLHTPTTLYGVSVLSSLESYGHIVLGHPQLSCRIENLSYSGLLVA